MPPEMRFGAFVTPQAPVEDDHVATTRRFVARAALAERCGFDGVFVGEHIASDEYAFYESLTLLSAMAARTERIDLGTAITVAPIHHPVRFASRTATLDVLSGGRFVAGFGTGGRPPEFDAFDVPIDERIPRTTEAVEVVRRLWSEPRVSHEGTHFSFADLAIHPKPAQEEVPVWFGFNGEQGLDYVAREGFGWLALSQVPEETWEERVDTFHAALDRHGRAVDDVEMAVMVEVSVAGDHEAAVEAMAEPVVEKYREYAGRERQPEAVRGLDPEEVTFEHLEDMFVVGTPGDAIDAFESYREQGFDYVLARPPALQSDEDVIRRTMELLGEEVFPHFRE